MLKNFLKRLCDTLPSIYYYDSLTPIYRVSKICLCGFKVVYVHFYSTRKYPGIYGLITRITQVQLKKDFAIPLYMYYNGNTRCPKCAWGLKSKSGASLYSKMLGYFFLGFFNTRRKPNKCMNTPGSYKYNDYIYINSRFESSPNEEEEERKKRYEEGEIFLFEKCIKWFFFVDFLFYFRAIFSAEVLILKIS